MAFGFIVNDDDDDDDNKLLGRFPSNVLVVLVVLVLVSIGDLNGLRINNDDDDAGGGGGILFFNMILLLLLVLMLVLLLVLLVVLLLALSIRSPNCSICDPILMSLPSCSCFNSLPSITPLYNIL